MLINPFKPVDPSCKECNGSGFIQVGQFQKVCHCRINLTNQEGKTTMFIQTLSDLADPSCEICKGSGFTHGENMPGNCVCIKRKESEINHLIVQPDYTTINTPTILTGDFLKRIANPSCAYCLGSGIRNNGYHSYPCNCVYQIDMDSITKIPGSCDSTKTIHISATSPSITIEEEETMLEKTQVPKNVVDAITHIRKEREWNNDRFLNFEFIQSQAYKGDLHFEAIDAYIKKVGPAVYAKVIVTDDWEVEKTTKDKLKDCYKEILFESKASNVYRQGAAATFNKIIEILSKDYPELKDVIKNV